MNLNIYYIYIYIYRCSPKNSFCDNIAQILGLSKREPKQSSLIITKPARKPCQKIQQFQFDAICSSMRFCRHDWWYKSNPIASESRQRKTLRLRGSADSSSVQAGKEMRPKYGNSLHTFLLIVLFFGNLKHHSPFCKQLRCPANDVRTSRRCT